MREELHSYLEPELEARVVALVMGESSAFEAEELGRLMEDRPEVAAFFERMSGLDGMAREAVCPPDVEEWKLSEGRRGKIFEKVAERKLAEEEMERRLFVAKRAQRNVLIGVAACFVVSLFLVVMGPVSSNHGVANEQKEPARIVAYAASESGIDEAVGKRSELFELEEGLEEAAESTGDPFDDNVVLENPPAAPEKKIQTTIDRKPLVQGSKGAPEIASNFGSGWGDGHGSGYGRNDPKKNPNKSRSFSESNLSGSKLDETSEKKSGFDEAPHRTMPGEIPRAQNSSIPEGGFRTGRSSLGTLESKKFRKSHDLDLNRELVQLKKKKGPISPMPPGARASRGNNDQKDSNGDGLKSMKNSSAKKRVNKERWRGIENREKMVRRSALGGEVHTPKDKGGLHKDQKGNFKSGGGSKSLLPDRQNKPNLELRDPEKNSHNEETIDRLKLAEALAEAKTDIFPKSLSNRSERRNSQQTTKNEDTPNQGFGDTEEDKIQSSAARGGGISEQLKNDKRQRGEDQNAAKEKSAESVEPTIEVDRSDVGDSSSVTTFSTFETKTRHKVDSTFSLNVSDVSFQLAQAELMKGRWPKAEKVRVEEFVNAMKYGDVKPSMSEKINCVVEQGAHPFLPGRNLMRVSMSTAALGRGAETPLRLTILLDQSGSMDRVDRAASVQKAFEALASDLTEHDEVTLVGFSRTTRLLAERVKGDEAKGLAEIVGRPLTEGGTHLEEALKTGMKMAEQQFLDGAQNRVILMTDGAANLGDAKPEGLSKLVAEMRRKGVSFDVCGVSAKELKDGTLRKLAKEGDGRYYLLNRPEDADESFAKQVAGALRPAAKNVKVQVLFNPERVEGFKLYGFEEHLLNKEDFRDD